MTGGTTNRLLTDIIQCGDVSGVQVTPHTTPDAIGRTMRPLREIVANIADRSHVRQIATNRTIKKSYDPV